MIIVDEFPFSHEEREGHPQHFPLITSDDSDKSGHSDCPLPEFSKKARQIKKKGFKKYGSMKDMVLPDAAKKKRDRALRNLKKKDKLWATKEIEEESLTSSDFRGRQNFLLRKARNILEFGKQVGFEIEGDRGEALLDCVRLLENQIRDHGEMEVMNLYAHWRLGIGVSSRFSTITDLSGNWITEYFEAITIIVIVHAPNVEEEQRVFWDELGALGS
ncbi:hypothetical protein GQ457_01G017410 [Hibiscus cannabinus]